MAWENSGIYWNQTHAFINEYNNTFKENLVFTGKNDLYDEDSGEYNSSTQLLTIDYTGHSTEETAVETTLLTLSNGVSCVMKSWLFTYGTPPEGHINFVQEWHDKDGDLLEWSDHGNMDHCSSSFEGLDVTNYDISAYPVYYSKIGFCYQYTTEETLTPGVTEPTHYVPYFTFIGHKNNPSPYDAPNPLKGGLRPDNMWTYYTTTGDFPRLNTYEGFEQFIDALQGGGDDTPIEPGSSEDDTSKPGGGDGDYNPLSDKIPFPGLPTGDSISTGFIRVYNPSGAQLQALSHKLWSQDFYNTIEKIMNDPMEAIISLHSVPYQPNTGVGVVCEVGNYDSGVVMPTVESQFYSLNLGSIYIPEHWASALDYSPYVTVDLFLPYIGVITLQVDDAIGKDITVRYNTDILTGATVAMVMCGDSVLYSRQTDLIYKHPFTMSSFGPLYQSIMSLVGNTLSGAVSGGIGGAVGGALGSGINVALSKHSNISRGGSLGGSAGCLGDFAPYLIIHRPIQSLASGFKHFKGYPSNITATIGSVSGYSEIESVHLTGIPCTDIERDEINALLYNGVIV